MINMQVDSQSERKQVHILIKVLIISDLSRLILASMSLHIHLRIFATDVSLVHAS